MVNRPRTKMPVSHRAKQFMPFSAVKGLAEALARKEKEIVSKGDLSTERTVELNEKLVRLKKDMTVTVMYFDNGEYLQVSGKIILFDSVNRALRIEDTKISFDAIRDINIDEECAQ